MATGAWKLDESDVVGIKRLIKQGMKDGDIAERYDVSREHIWKIRHDERWAWVEPQEYRPKRSNDFRDFGTHPKDKLIKRIEITYADGTKLVI